MLTLPYTSPSDPVFHYHRLLSRAQMRQRECLCISSVQTERLFTDYSVTIPLSMHARKNKPRRGYSTLKERSKSRESRPSRASECAFAFLPPQTCTSSQ